MLTKKKRVTKDIFQIIMKTGRVIHSPLFTFRYVKGDTRYAFAVPKSVAKKAVDRNRLRRQGYNALRLHNLQPISGVFMYKKTTTSPSFQEVKENVNSIFSKV